MDGSGILCNTRGEIGPRLLSTLTCVLLIRRCEGLVYRNYWEGIHTYGWNQVQFYEFEGWLPAVDTVKDILSYCSFFCQSVKEVSFKGIIGLICTRYKSGSFSDSIILGRFRGWFLIFPLWQVGTKVLMVNRNMVQWCHNFQCRE